MNNLKDLLISPEPFIRVPLWQLQVPKWKKVLALTGYPVADCRSNTLSPPFTSIIFVLFLILFALPFSKPLKPLLVLDPSNPFRFEGLTLFSCALVHSGFWHLAANLALVIPILDLVEQDLGHLKIMLLMALSAAGSAGLHLLLSPLNENLLGSSGLCLGIFTYYCLKYSKIQLRFYIPVLSYFSTDFQYRLSPFVIIGLYAVQELSVVRAQLNGEGGDRISHIGHLGGIIVGIVFWALNRNRKPLLCAANA
jgi:membrane associated rhomboid family serine protease